MFQKDGFLLRPPVQADAEPYYEKAGFQTVEICENEITMALAKEQWKRLVQPSI